MVSFSLQARQPSHSFPTGAENCQRQAETILFEMIENQENKAWPKRERYDDRKREYREQIRECNRNYPRARGKKEREVLLKEAAPCSN